MPEPDDASDVVAVDVHERLAELGIEANAAAVRAELPADLVFANHVLLGAPVGAAA